MLARVAIPEFRKFYEKILRKLSIREMAQLIRRRTRVWLIDWIISRVSEGEEYDGAISFLL